MFCCFNSKFLSLTLSSRPVWAKSTCTQHAIIGVADYLKAKASLQFPLFFLLFQHVVFMHLGLSFKCTLLYFSSDPGINIRAQPYSWDPWMFSWSAGTLLSFVYFCLFPAHLKEKNGFLFETLPDGYLCSCEAVKRTFDIFFPATRIHTNTQTQTHTHSSLKPRARHHRRVQHTHAHTSPKSVQLSSLIGVSSISTLGLCDLGGSGPKGHG